MSRKTNNAKGGSGEKQEQLEFLFRSLDRNDVEIAALIDLHQSIHAVKQAIIRNCGEDTLLDLGEGKLKLAPSLDSLQVADGTDLELPPQESQHLCVDFLLRMKLRRKLMNRLSRRLLRVAHYMDGNDVQPPSVPKYGEQRLHLDPERIKAFSEHQANREMAIRAIECARERIHNKEEKLLESEEDTAKQVQPTDADGAIPAQVQSTDTAKDAAAQPETTETEIASPDQPQSTISKKGGEEQVQAVGTETTAPEQTQSTKTENTTQDGEGIISDKPQSPKPDVDTSMVAPGEHPPTETNADGASKSNHEDVMEACYDILTDYKDTYEKRVDPATGAVTYPALEAERETSSINTSTGIGAVHSSMSLKEKEAEDQKWKAALLSRIPDQPTFEELGIENRVFRLEDRRKRVMKQVDADESKRVKIGQSGEDTFDVDDDEDAPDDSEEKSKMQDDKDENKSENTEDKEAMNCSEEEGGPGNKSVSNADEEGNEEDTQSNDKEVKSEDADNSDGESSKKDQDSGKRIPSNTSKEKTETVPVRTKPISLLPVPSFHDQDLKRVKLIHADLMMSSLQDQARLRLEGVTRDYNNALAKSNELYDRQQKIQEELNIRRHGNAIMRNQAEMHIAKLKEAWYAKWKQFNDGKLNAVLPSRHGFPRTGSFATQQYGRRDALCLEISDCLADVVDAVDKIAQGAVQNEKFSEPLILPPMPPEYEQSIKYETVLAQQCQTLMLNIRASEEDRNRCWKKMLKTKAEFEVGSGARGVDASRIAMMPLPPLRTTAPQRLPQQMYRPALSTYTPKARIVRQTEPATGSSASDSKYSAARIKERISDDGTVAPVSEPKKTKEGLFQRPAGRTRKGMEWDAVRGIWVPSKDE